MSDTVSTPVGDSPESEGTPDSVSGSPGGAEVIGRSAGGERGGACSNSHTGIRPRAAVSRMVVGRPTWHITAAVRLTKRTARLTW